jgi:saccharopine dehydrogenase-like NADP-dependent oxidoreductase
MAEAKRTGSSLMRVAVLGAGAVGARVARQLLVADSVDQLVLRDTSAERLAWAARTIGDRVIIEHHPFPTALDADAVVVTSPRGTQLAAVKEAISTGRPAVLACDGLAETIAILKLDRAARDAGIPVVVGAGFAPGLTCVLVAHGMSWFDEVDEIHIYKMGAGGPACALVHHRALSRFSYDWRDGDWIRRPGGSGRELCWFPEPVGPRDCYRAALADPVLLHHAFPGIDRITSRMAATRRDRLTATMPMLAPAHAEGGSGAVRVELRGRRGTTQETLVLGATERPAVGAAAVVAIATEWVLSGKVAGRGMSGLAEVDDPVGFLGELAERGLVVEVFEGDGVVV